jgi:antirestriction protein ArdC
MWNFFKNIEIPTPDQTFVPNLFENEDQKMVDLFTGLVNGPAYKEGLGYDPCYSRATDTVKMATSGQFESWEEYIMALSHEYAHATGHSKRLNRKSLMQSMGMGDSENYPKDELIAELTATMFASYFGFLDKVAENSANYLGGWIRRLNDFDDNGKKHFMWAVKQAQKAFEYILENQP